MGEILIPRASRGHSLRDDVRPVTHPPCQALGSPVITELLQHHQGWAFTCGNFGFKHREGD